MSLCNLCEHVLNAACMKKKIWFIERERESDGEGQGEGRWVIKRARMCRSCEPRRAGSNGILNFILTGTCLCGDVSDLCLSLCCYGQPKMIKIRAG